MRNLPQNSGQEALPPDHFQQENDQGGIADMGLTQLMDKYKALGYVQVAGPFELPSVIAATTKT